MQKGHVRTVKLYKENIVKEIPVHGKMRYFSKFTLIQELTQIRK